MGRGAKSPAPHLLSRWLSAGCYGALTVAMTRPSGPETKTLMGAVPRPDTFASQTPFDAHHVIGP